MALITYEDKDNSLPTSNPRRLYRDVDANEVKDVVNANQAIVEALDAADVGADASGTAAGLVATEVTNRNAAIAAAAVGLWDDRGTFDASVAAYPSSGGSGTAGAILKGDIWTISVAGTLPTGQVVEIGDTVRALIDTPGNTQANWGILQNNIGFVPENVANKVSSISASATQYPNNNAIIAFFAPYVIDQATPSVAGGTITLDMNSQKQRSFIGSATFAAAKILALSNTTSSLFFNFIFEITSVAAVLTFPSDWLSSSLDFNGTDWTPPNTGKFEFGGSFDDVNNFWYVKVSGPFQ